MPGGASKTLEITFSVDFIVEEGTNRIFVGRQQSVHLPNVGSRPLRPARHHRAHGERLGHADHRAVRTLPTAR